jgi:Na+-driven multidrug efflux pump
MLRIGLDQMESGHAGFLVAVCLVVVVVFPPIFFSDYHGASVKRTFVGAALAAVAAVWVCTLIWSPLRPGGRPPEPRYYTAAGTLSGIAILLIVLLPVPALAGLAGFAEGFFVACILLWAMDFYRLTRWRRRTARS